MLTRAGRPFPVEPIRTRDAIHLATADLLGEAPQLVTVLTRDTRVHEHAQALGTWSPDSHATGLAAR